MNMKLLMTLLAATALSSCNSGPASPPTTTPAAATTQAESTPKLESDWQISEPQVNPMDGVVSRFISTRGFAYIQLCFDNGKPCSVPVAVVAPKSCFIESNVEGSNYSRRVRVKFDDEKPSTAIWGITDRHNGIFPHGSQAFIAKLKKHSNFVIEFGCDASDSDVITMEIKGLQSSLDAIKK